MLCRAVLQARFHKQALVEVKVLTHIKENDPRDETNSVRMHEHFSFRSHLCIVFELLSFNLYEVRITARTHACTAKSGRHAARKHAPQAAATHSHSSLLSRPPSPLSL